MTLGVGRFKIAVRSVPQGYKGGAVLEGDTVNPWHLCPHFHRTEKAAIRCALKDLGRKMNRVSP